MKSDWESTDGHFRPFLTCIFGVGCHCYGDLDLWHRHPRLVQVKTWQALLMQKQRPEHFFVKRDGMKLKSPNFWEFEENFWVLVLKFFAKIWDVLNKKVSAFGKQTNNFLRRTGSPTCFIWVKRSDDFSKMYSFLSQYQIITPTEWIYFGSVCCDIICQEEHFFVNSCQCLLPWMLQLYF